MIKQIEYENKQAIQNDDSIANKNKVTAEDMNEIKNVVNQNAKELETLQEDNQGNETAIGTLQNDISLIKQNNSEQDKSIQSNTSKIEAINKSIEAINKKNTEQDTNIQKNAKDIETNQNNIKALQVKNAEVKAENERLRSDIESISLLGEAEGESIDLDDSSRARFKKFGVGGNHSQETREGYNILDLSKKPYNEQASSLNGATVTQKNGILTIDAMNATDLVTVKSVWKSYTDSTNIKMPKGNYYTPLTLNISKVESGESVGQKTGNFTLEEDCVCTQWFYNVEKGKKIELPLFISNNQNKTAYEQYGVMPSLEFPSEIKAVKDNVNVVVCNKNLFKETSNNKKIKTAYGYLISGNYMLKKGKKYAVSFDTNNNGGKVYLNENVLKFAGSTYDAACDSKRHTIIATATVDGYQNNRNLIKTGVATTDYYDVSNISVCEYVNDSSSDFVEHQEQTITMPVQQEMLKGDYFDWVNEKEVHKWAKLIFDGTENWLQSGNVYPTFYISPDEIASKFGIPTNLKALCNYFTQKSNIWGIDEIGFDTANLRQDHVDFRFCLGSNSTITTLEAWKNKLVEMYNSGNPLVLYFQIFTQDELDFTDEQKVVAKKIKETLHTYKNITHIYSTDETGPIMNVEYAKDPNTQNNNLQNQIDEIKQLISTTQTSAMLLDNLQKEVESEVE